jgi:hypothetical protein
VLELCPAAWPRPFWVAAQELAAPVQRSRAGILGRDGQEMQSQPSSQVWGCQLTHSSLGGSRMLR